MKSKLVFAGVMGAILMSAGANAATTIATQGYVDSKLALPTGTTSVAAAIANAVNGKADADDVEELSTTVSGIQETIEGLGATYEVLGNKVNTALADVNETDAATKYPTVGAVKAYVTTAMDGVDTTALKDIVDALDGTGLDTVIGDVSELKDDVSQLQTDVAAIPAQVQANWNEMDEDSKAFIKNKPTIPTSISQLEGSSDLVTSSSLNTTLGDYVESSTLENYVTTTTANTTYLSKTDASSTYQTKADANTLAATVADNTAAIAKKIDKPLPADCASGNKTCVLMVQNGALSWVYVTDPVEDPVTTPSVPSGV